MPPKKVEPTGGAVKKAAAPKKAPKAKGAKKVAPAPDAAAPVAAAPAPTPAPVAVAAEKVLTPLEEARRLWRGAAPEGTTITKHVVVYSSYKKAFEARDGHLRWQDIDEEYAISFVFKGSFTKHVRKFPAGATTASVTADAAPLVAEVAGHEGYDDAGQRDVALDELYFAGFDPTFTGRYVLEVHEDEKAGLGVKTRDGPIQFAENPNQADTGISGAPRKEGCSCLYDKYVCENWDKRFEVAKKNGWKSL